MASAPKLILAALFTLAATAQGFCGDDYPTRPVRIVVPYAAGGPSDTGARLVAEPLGQQLGQSVYIENRGGAGGLSATEAFLNWEPDGYSLLLGGIAPLTIIPSAEKVPYDAQKDFIPIGTLWRSAQTLVVRSGLGVKTMSEFIAYAKENPGKLSIASAGTGTVSHLALELLKTEAGIDVIHVPYRSTGASLPSVLGGQVDGLFGDASVVAPQVRSGGVRALAVAAPQRSPALPDVVTMAEASLPGVEAEGWHGLVVSARTPPAIVARLQSALAAAQKNPAYLQNLAKLGASIGTPGPEGLAELIRNDTKKWSAIIEHAGIKF